MISSPVVFKPFLIILLLNLLKQLSGMNIITAYCVRIFGDIFRPLDVQAIDATVGVT